MTATAEAAVVIGAAPAFDWLRDALGARSADEWRERYEGSSPFVVEGLVHAAVTLVYGSTESGKTFLMAHMMSALARGETWLGQPIHGGPYRCLVLAAEAGGHREYGERVDPDLGDRVVVVPPSFVPRVDVERWQTLADQCVARGFGVVVVDNFSAWTGAVDVNATKEVGGALACLRALTQAGVAVVLVHHSNSANRKVAGVYTIPAFARHTLELTETKLKSHGNDAPKVDYWLHREGKRVLDGGRVPDGDLEASPRDSGERDRAATPARRTRPATAQQQRQQRVLEAVQGAPAGLGWNDTARHVADSLGGGTTKDQASGVMRTLIKQGRWAGVPSSLTPATE